jgi:hypothetical protein
MGNIFSKFFMSFGLNKNKYLPAGTEDVNTSATVDLANSANNTVVAAMRNAAKASNISKTSKTLASFDLSIEKPKFEGAIPEATIKFYPLD